MTTPVIIQQHHRERLAVVYGRQSTREQVEENIGSAEYQRSQVRYPLEWGWHESRIHWYDDFGLTGTAAAHRRQYLEMRDLVRRHEVGIVVTADHSRLGRDAAELLSFFADCLAHDVLIAINGRISNPRDTNDWLYDSLLAVLSQHGGLNIRDTLLRGRKGKLESGKAVSVPPVGYEKGADSGWSVTSDLAVRVAISGVFRTYLEVRSLSATVLRLLERGHQVPIRTAGGGAKLVTPTIGRVYSLLGNPNYTQDYYYGRHVVDLTKSRDPIGHHRRRKAKPDEVFIIRDHHDGYITREQWDEIQAIFKKNAWTRDHANAGSGAAIVGRWVRCGVHREWKMHVNYKRGPRSDPGSYYAYWCNGDYETGESKCGRVPGRRVDDVVVQAVLKRLSPPSIAAIQDALERALTNAQAEHRHREIETVQLKQQIAELQRKLDVLDPDSFEVFKHFEHQLERAKRRKIALENVDDAARERMRRQHRAILAEAMQLAPDIPRILSAPTTTNGDRRRLVEILVRGVIIEEWSNERLPVRICWTDDAPDTLVDVWLAAGVERLIPELRAKGESFAHIACLLNDLGSRTARGRVWAEQNVRNFLKDRTPRRRARRHERQRMLRDRGSRGVG